MLPRLAALALLTVALSASAAGASPPTFSTSPLAGSDDGTEPRMTVAPDDTRYVVTNAGGTAVVYASKDGGLTWSRTESDPPGQTVSTIDTDIVAYPTGRILASELDFGGINFPSGFSDDGGKTWTQSRGSTQLADQDRQWFAVDPHDGGANVYMLYHNLASGVAQHNMWVAHSGDGGATFGPPIPIALPPTDAWNDLQCSDSGGPSTLQVNPRTGRVYAFWTTRSSVATGTNVNTGGCGASVFGPLEFNIVNATRVWSAYSDDHGTSWHTSLAVDDSRTGQIVSMQLAYGALDNAGNVYVAYPESPQPYPKAGGAALKLTHADADLTTWSKPATLLPPHPDGDLGVTLVHVVAGDPGKIALGFYEAEHLPGIPEPVWYAHVGQSLDALDATPAFSDQKVSDVPAYRWTASEMMGICGAEGPAQGVENGLACSRSTDVWGITLDSACRVSITWTTKGDEFANGNGGTKELPGSQAATFVSTQTGGSDLCGANAIPGGTQGAAFTAPPAPAGCSDALAPVSRVRTAAVRRGRLTIAGTSRDPGCAGRLRAVAVAVRRQSGRGRCRYLHADGRLGRAGGCARATYLVARGTRSWRLDLKTRLPRGTYVAWARGTDAANNVERTDRRDNLRRFRVR
jgi:BNR repeat protein